MGRLFTIIVVLSIAASCFELLKQWLVERASYETTMYLMNRFDAKVLELVVIFKNSFILGLGEWLLDLKQKETIASMARSILMSMALQRLLN